MSKYWENRIANKTWRVYNTLEEQNIELFKMYREASDNISKELYAVAERINKGKEISLSDMHKFNRLSGLQDNFEGIIKELGEQVENFARDNMHSGYKDVYENTSKSVNSRQFTIPNKRVMDEILDRPWQGGSFSSRLWKNTGQLANALNEDLTVGLQQGKTIAEISINLANKMSQGFNVTHRLVRTETMHYLNNSALRAYKDKEVEEIRIWVAKDERLCKHCNSYHDKVYHIDKAPVVPFHANCRCTYLPVIEVEEEDIVIGKSVGAAAFRDKVLLPSGSYGKLAEGTKITKVVVFAGKGTSKEIKVAKYLEKQYNVPIDEWKKVRGDGYVEYPDGNIKHVELHWFESNKTGRVKMKEKRVFKDES